MTSFLIEMLRPSRVNVEASKLSSFRDIKNHFVTAPAAVASEASADIDDSVKRKCDSSIAFRLIMI